ncbi:MAG: GntR family transcriptional regulator [Terrimesophilobacter sp.]
MSISSIRKVDKVASLRERIRESLAAAIVSGELAPGTMVTVPVLAADFEVSATPVREAMLDLEQRGFVQSVANKGFRVTEVSQQDLQEIIEIRTLLEGPIMAELSKTMKPEQIPQWRLLADRISEHADAGNLTEFLEADREFHLGLIGLHGNRRLVAMVKELRSQTRMIGLAKMTNTPELSKSGREHHEMLDLMESGDDVALRALMANHFAHVLAWWGPSAGL